MNERARIRIGQISYTNAWPLCRYFPRHCFSDKVEVVCRTPSGLNLAMSNAEIDIGPISSFAYGEQFDRYVLYPDLSVSSYGEVGSILLFHRRPLERITSGRIALPTSSATSANLLRILLEKFYGGRPRYSCKPPDLDDMMCKADAALLIGDDAIRAKWTNREYMVTDLGSLWKQHTGRWMTFAVWAVRARTLTAHPLLVRKVFYAFQQAKIEGLKNLDALAAEAQTRVGGAHAFWLKYFSRMSYDFGRAQWDGLRAYFRCAFELKRLARPVPLRLWDDRRASGRSTR